MYESPQLSDTHEIEVCSSEKYDQLIIEESDTEGENSSGIFRKIKSKQETIIAPGWLKSNDCTVGYLLEPCSSKKETCVGSL